MSYSIIFVILKFRNGRSTFRRSIFRLPPPYIDGERQVVRTMDHRLLYNVARGSKQTNESLVFSWLNDRVPRMHANADSIGRVVSEPRVAGTCLAQPIREHQGEYRRYRRLTRVASV